MYFHPYFILGAINQSASEIKSRMSNYTFFMDVLTYHALDEMSV